MKASKRNLAVLAMGLASSLALGQNADKNGAGPTRNDYRLRVVEPAEGAIIAGTRVQVTVNLEIPGQPADERKDGNTMPQPNVVVFLDDERRGDLRDLDNVLTLDDVKPGRHSITLLAMNKAGEVIDRKVIGFESTPANGSAVAPVAQPAVPCPCRRCRPSPWPRQGRSRRSNRPSRSRPATLRGELSRSRRPAPAIPSPRGQGSFSS